MTSWICTDCGIDVSKHSVGGIQGGLCNSCIAKNFPEEERILCVECGRYDSHKFWALHPSNKYCNSCSFWMYHYEQDNLDSKFQALIIGNKHYSYDRLQPIKNTHSKYLGHGGARYKIQLLDTGKIIETNDLWYQGVIPDRFISLFKVNARFISD